MQDIEVYVKACEKCQKGKRDCKVESLGAACVGCHLLKYKCDRTHRKDAKTMWVRRPIPDSASEVEVLEEKPKGTKRRAESPDVSKKDKGKAKTTVKEEKSKAKAKGKDEKPKATAKKAKAKPRTVRKSPAIVVDSSQDEVMIVDEVESEGEAKPKPKRARLAQGMSNKSFSI
jgi:hypothetical protein